MLSDLKKSIALLDDWQTLICCRGLVLLIDRQMALNPQSGRPTGLSVTDFNQWVQLGGRPAWSLVSALCDKRLAVTAATGRQLLQSALDWGFHREVHAACRLAYAPVDHLGTLAPVTVMAALATVLRWHPSQPSMDALLCPPPANRAASPSFVERRFPWFQSSAVAQENAKTENEGVTD
jgi:hypothetical protein